MQTKWNQGTASDICCYLGMRPHASDISVIPGNKQGEAFLGFHIGLYNKSRKSGSTAKPSAAPKSRNIKIDPALVKGVGVSGIHQSCDAWCM